MFQLLLWWSHRVYRSQALNCVVVSFEFRSLLPNIYIYIYKLSFIVSYQGSLAAQGVEVQNHARRTLAGGEEKFLRDFVAGVRNNHPYEKECECSGCYPFGQILYSSSWHLPNSPPIAVIQAVEEVMPYRNFMIWKLFLPLYMLSHLLCLSRMT